MTDGMNDGVNGNELRVGASDPDIGSDKPEEGNEPIFNGFGTATEGEFFGSTPRA